MTDPSTHADAVTLERLRVNNESSVDVNVVVDITRANVRFNLCTGIGGGGSNWMYSV